MFLALKDGVRIEAEPFETALCPTCGATVVPKCGSIVAWHWAHESSDCDQWSEEETQWHLDWKAQFPAEWREVCIGSHRADIKSPRGVIEFQHSPISGDEIEERERYYQQMAWVFDARRIRRHIDVRRRDGYVSFRWKWPRKSLPCGGWGRYVWKRDFLGQWGVGREVACSAS